MKLKQIHKKNEGNFVTRYDLAYETIDEKEKIYEIISRNKNIQTLEDLQNNHPDAVVLILHNETGDKVLLNKEFRMAVGKWVYNFPAGLIDEGEEPEESAKRELKEETGLDLIKIEEVLFNSYSAVGFSNEVNVCVVGTANGTFQESSSTFEEIEAGWYTKEEVLSLMQEHEFAARTQAYCYAWAKYAK